MFYDLYVHTSGSIGESTLDDVTAWAKRLGIGGLGIVFFPEQLQSLPALPRGEVDLASVCVIKANTPSEMEQLVARSRSKAEVIAVYGGNYDINRAACSNSAVDVLLHPELGRHDSGLDHICARAAHENNVAIELNFHSLLEAHRRHRISVLAAMRKNIMLCRKYDAPIITASGALSKWDMRSGRELASLAYLLGLELGKAIDSVSLMPEQIVRINREKLVGKRWEGVRIVEEDAKGE
ncbi:MAG: RNase P subunit p30 family protein [Candidatus Aenigmatarchaeota archaeon]